MPAKLDQHDFAVYKPRVHYLPYGNAACYHSKAANLLAKLMRVFSPTPPSLVSLYNGLLPASLEAKLQEEDMDDETLNEEGAVLLFTVSLHSEGKPGERVCMKLVMRRRRRRG